MKLTDYVIDFFAKRGIRHSFVLQGGAVAHLIDSAQRHSQISVVPMQHEQAAAMAADAYARVSESGFGLAMATSGPGATNLITGIACSYYDSISSIFITGNVASFRQSDRIGVRQYGFQETNIVDMCKPVSKYAVRLSSPDHIRYELEKALHIARQGRPGPVLIDIPDDFQREIIKPDQLPGYCPDKTTAADTDAPQVIASTIAQLLPLIETAQRPVLVFGAGVAFAGVETSALQLAKKLSIPFLYTWALKGITDWSDPLCAGTFGTNSPRYGNFTIQNADLIIAIGSRLDTHATGKLDLFAREAKIAIVDLDRSELNKFQMLGKTIEHVCCADAAFFIDALDKATNEQAITARCALWLKQINLWKQRFQPALEQVTAQIDPYQFFKKLSDYTASHRLFTLDTGAGLAYFMTNYYETKGQRVITAFNNTPMGYALPAAIGAAFATDKTTTIICISGDGGLQINIQELATLAYHRLPVKIIVVNNDGHTMIKQTQDDWLNANYYSSSTDYGLPALAFKPIANAYGINALTLEQDSDIDSAMTQLLQDNAPCLLDITINPAIRIDPMIKWGRPLEDASPLLSREQLKAEMSISTINMPDDND